MKSPLLPCAIVLRAVLFGAVVAVMPATSALAESLPRKDLMVVLRETSDSDNGFNVSTRPVTPPLTGQAVRVRNGEKATLRMGRSMSVRWEDSVAGFGGRNVSGGGVQYGRTTLQAGQSITVQPRWTGGNNPVVVSVEIQTSSVAQADARVGSDLPTQVHGETMTTVSAPMGQWVTLAADEPEDTGVLSSDSAGRPRRLLQLRVFDR
ncbi:hypothetical protein [Variovorax sp. HJSM1_2]|uniref:hypothetical protein n=1 Tax=Variovorax sp. HJSM1_2 TaxID=3366263 RepID=UPI003BE78094